VIGNWRCHDNTICFHSSLGYRPPAPEMVYGRLRRPPRPLCHDTDEAGHQKRITTSSVAIDEYTDAVDCFHQVHRTQLRAGRTRLVDPPEGTGPELLSALWLSCVHQSRRLLPPRPDPSQDPADGSRPAVLRMVPVILEWVELGNQPRLSFLQISDVFADAAEHRLGELIDSEEFRGFREPALALAPRSIHNVLWEPVVVQVLPTLMGLFRRKSAVFCDSLPSVGVASRLDLLPRAFITSRFWETRAAARPPDVPSQA
jgi:hypothetical protein